MAEVVLQLKSKNEYDRLERGQKVLRMALGRMSQGLLRMDDGEGSVDTRERHPYPVLSGLFGGVYGRMVRWVTAFLSSLFLRCAKCKAFGAVIMDWGGARQ